MLLCIVVTNCTRGLQGVPRSVRIPLGLLFMRRYVFRTKVSRCVGIFRWVKSRNAKHNGEIRLLCNTLGLCRIDTKFETIRLQTLFIETIRESSEPYCLRIYVYIYINKNHLPHVCNIVLRSSLRMARSIWLNFFFVFVTNKTKFV